VWHELRELVAAFPIVLMKFMATERTWLAWAEGELHLCRGGLPLPMNLIHPPLRARLMSLVWPTGRQHSGGDGHTCCGRATVRLPQCAQAQVR
jgi:hypothetical protein